MTWFPLEYMPRQYVNSSGLPYSGAVLKAYDAQTNTVIPMATDFTGATTATSFVLNAAGYVSSGGSVIIPHVEKKCKLALYPTQAAADANSGAVWNYDNIQVSTGSNAERLINFAADTGSVNAYVIAPDPAITAYALGQLVTLVPQNSNTGASTLAISGLATKNITKNSNGTFVNIAAGDLTANVPVFMFYNGTSFILLGATSSSFTATSTIGATDDWNTLTTTGSYITAGTTYINAPLYDSATVGILRIYAATALATRIQEWTETASGDVWQRTYDGTKWTIWRPISKPTARSTYTEYWNEFRRLDTNEVTSSQTGTGASVALSAQAADVHRGIVTLSTGTTSTGWAYAGSLATSYDLEASSKFRRHEATIDIPTLSDGTNRFFAMMYLNTGYTTRTDNTFLGFAYKDDVNSGNWVCVSDSAGTETVVNTTVPPVAGTQQKLRIEVNPAKTSVTFYIDDVLVGTITTNIVASNSTHPRAVLQIEKTVGATARTLRLDNLYNQYQR